MLEHRPPHEHGHRLAATARRLVQTVLTRQPVAQFLLARMPMAMVPVRREVPLQQAVPR